jgi:hypothetical protein
MAMAAFVRLTSLAILVAVTAGCTTSAPSALGTPAAAPAPSGSAPAASGQGTHPIQSSGLLGALPVPHGATPWPGNTGTPMGLTRFVRIFYIKSACAREMGLYQRRGFTSGVIEGWINPDGTQQEIELAHFSGSAGAKSLFRGLTSTLKDESAPVQGITDATDGGVGTVDPTLDHLGNATAEMVGHTGDYVIDVHEFTAASPDAAKAENLLLTQYTVLKG